ncbi:MAG: XdhC family protein [Betaproteobacteria bacterium]|nr:MAG: XdhC family protein [Betaproteobacteria bacterium]
MDNLDLDVLKTALAWTESGRRATLGTVVRTWGSAPRPIGAMMAIRDDGQVIGSVSGGCIEDDLIAQVKDGKLAAKLPESVRYGVAADQARQFGLPCGGTVEMVLEPLTPQSDIRGLLAELEGHAIVRRSLDLSTGIAHRRSASGADVLSFDGQTLVTIHGPKYRLLIIGAGQLSKYLATMAIPLDYQVTVCDPRDEYQEQWHDLPQVTMTKEMPDDTVLAMNLDRNSAVVALTHDPKLDDLALMEALKGQAFYVGALGSKSNNDERRQRLLEFDVSTEEIKKLRGPVGLDIGAKTPSEIAISILAEMTATKRGVTMTRSKSDLAESETTSAGCRI